jgi:hypothetical protein
MKKYVILFLSLVILNALSGQPWSPRIDFGIDGADDTDPHTCRAAVYLSCLVWESDVHGNQDIISRFINYGDLTDTMSITLNADSDINASVAFDYTRDCFWCVWQSDRNGNWDIFTAYGDSENGWSAPYELGSDTLDDINPSVYVDYDTVWVVWNSGGRVQAVHFAGGVWSSSQSISTCSDSTQPCINGRNSNPLVVWSSYDLVYYSVCTDTIWTAPELITTGYEYARFPEICTESWYSPYCNGAWIVWQAYSDYPDWNIHVTKYDTFDVNYQVTVHDSMDITPCPLFFLAIDGFRQMRPGCTAFCTNRNGNYDIYADWLGYFIEPVDTSPANDNNPVLTQSGFHLWAFWQTDLDGDWDIYARFIDFNAIEEFAAAGTRENKIISAAPNPFSRSTRITWNLEELHCDHIVVFDICGRKVRKLNINGLQGDMIWYGDDDNKKPLPGGVYFIGVGNKAKQKIIISR